MFMDSNKAKQFFEKTMSFYKRDPESFITKEMKNRMTPSSLKCMQICGISYFCIVLCIVFSCAYTTLPVVYAYDLEIMRNRQLLAWFFLVQIVVNFYLTRKVSNVYEPTKNPVHAQVLIDPSWKKCIDCNHLVPPRVHHCSLCHSCILKRDHHCFFVGKCVGYYNMRFFLVYCLYCAVTGCYFTYVNFLFLSTVPSDATNDLGWSRYFFPSAAIRMMTGSLETNYSLLWYIFVFDLIAFTTNGCVGISMWQYRCLVYGKTTSEYLRDGITSNKIESCSDFVGLMKKFNLNIRTVFGPFWLLNFVMPCHLCLKPKTVEWGGLPIHYV